MKACHQIATSWCFSALIDESRDKGEELAFSVRYLKSCHALLNKPKIEHKYELLRREMYPSKQVKHNTQQIDIRWGCKYEPFMLYLKIFMLSS